MVKKIKNDAMVAQTVLLIVLIVCPIVERASNTAYRSGTKYKEHVYISISQKRPSHFGTRWYHLPFWGLQRGDVPNSTSDQECPSELPAEGISGCAIAIISLTFQLNSYQ